MIRSPPIADAAARKSVDIAAAFVGGEIGIFAGVDGHRSLLWALFSRGVYRAHDAKRLADAWMQTMFAFEHPFTPDPMLDGLPTTPTFLADVADNIAEQLTMFMRDSAFRARLHWWATAPRSAHGSVDLDTLGRLDMPLSGARDLLTGKVPSDALASMLPGTVVAFARHIFAIDPASPHTRACDILPMLVAAATRADGHQLQAWIDKGLIELILSLAAAPGRAQPSACLPQYMIDGVSVAHRGAGGALRDPRKRDPPARRAAPSSPCAASSARAQRRLAHARHCTRRGHGRLRDAQRLLLDRVPVHGADRQAHALQGLQVRSVLLAELCRVRLVSSATTR